MLHVDTVQCSVTGLGAELAVHRFALTVALNSVPVITLECTPVAAQGVGIHCHAPDFAEITSLFQTLLARVPKYDAHGTVDIDITVNGESNAQHVTLTDWVLTDVGLSTVTPIASPVLVVVLSHPVTMLDKTGTLYENPESPLAVESVFSSVDGEDTVSIMDSVYNGFANDLDYHLVANLAQGGSDEQAIAIVKAFRNMLTTYPPGKYMKGTGGMFLAQQAPGLDKEIRATIAEMTGPRPFCDSTWGRLVSSICPSLMQQVTPTYEEDKLMLEPSEPWVSPTLTVKSNLVTAVDVPPRDPNPIIGVAVHRADSIRDEAHMAAVRNGVLSDRSYAFYFPPKVKPGDLGRVLNIDDSPVIMTILGKAEGKNENHGAAAGNTMEDAYDPLSDDYYGKMTRAYAQAMFQSCYRKDCQARVLMTPVFTDANGTMLHPGRVIEVRDSESDAVLLEGQLLQLSVTGSMDGQAETSMLLGYVRPHDSSVCLVPDGTMNPCYSS